MTKSMIRLGLQAFLALALCVRAEKETWSTGGAAGAIPFQDWDSGGDLLGWQRGMAEGELDAPAAGGNPGGYLRYVTPTSAVPVVQTQYLFNETADFTGDLSDRELSLDFRGAGITGAAVRVVCGIGVNVAEWEFTFALSGAPAWSGAVVPLHAAGGWSFVSGNSAIPFMNCIRDVRRLGVYVAVQSLGGQAEVGLDNVRLDTLGYLLFAEYWEAAAPGGWTTSGAGTLSVPPAGGNPDGSLRFNLDTPPVPGAVEGELVVEAADYVGDLRPLVARFDLWTKGVSAAALLVTSGTGADESTWSYTLAPGSDQTWLTADVGFDSATGWEFVAGNAGRPLDAVMASVRRLAVKVVGLATLPGDVAVALDNWRFYGSEPTYVISVAAGANGTVSPAGPAAVTRSQEALFALAGAADPSYGYRDYAIATATFDGQSLAVPPATVDFLWTYDPVNRGGELAVTFQRLAVHGAETLWLDATAVALGVAPITDYVAFAEADHDGDGVPTWQERHMRTNPLDKDDVLAFTAVDEQQLAFQRDWPTTAGWIPGGSGVLAATAAGGNPESWLRFVFDAPAVPEVLTGELLPESADYAGDLRHRQLHFDVLARNLDAMAVIVDSGAGVNASTWSFEVAIPPGDVWTTRSVTFDTQTGWSFVAGNAGRPFDAVMAEATQVRVRAVGYSDAAGGLELGVDNWLMYGTGNGARLELSWRSEPGVTYRLNTTTNLANPFEVLVPSIPSTPPLNTYQQWLAPGKQRRFYRAEVVTEVSP